MSFIIHCTAEHVAHMQDARQTCQYAYCTHTQSVWLTQFRVHLARWCDPGVEGAVVVGKLLERNAEADYGYNAATNTYQDLVKAGIIDPLKVNPSSSVGLLKQCDWTSQSVHN
jgi:hypothetical protein